MDNIRIHMYNIGAFRIIWDEKSFTLKGEPTVVEKSAYSGNLKSTATILHKKSKGKINITHIVNRVLDNLPDINQVVESGMAKVEPYTDKTWQGSLLAKLKGEDYWKSVAWTHKEGIRNWFYYSLLKNGPIPVSEVKDELLNAVTKFERISM